MRPDKPRPVRATPQLVDVWRRAVRLARYERDDFVRIEHVVRAIAMEALTPDRIANPPLAIPTGRMTRDRLMPGDPVVEGD